MSGFSATRAADLIEYVETAARYEYMDLVNGSRAEGLLQDELRAVVQAFHVQTTLVWCPTSAWLCPRSTSIVGEDEVWAAATHLRNGCVAKISKKKRTQNENLSTEVSFRSELCPLLLYTTRGLCKESWRWSPDGEQMSRKNSSQNILGGTMSMLPFASSTDGQGINEQLLREYAFFLANKAEGTIEAYLRTVRQIMIWIAGRPGNGGRFQPQHFTKTAVEMYLASLEREGFSVSHRARVKSALSTFARWLIEEQGLLQKNPTRGIDLPAMQTLAPRQLSDDQRFILRSLVEQAGDRRGAALFALGYWAGCRVSDVSWLEMAHTRIGPKVGWLHVGHKGGKWRDIDLVNEARKPVYEYVQATHDPDRVYVFLSQRSERLTEEGIHHWFRSLKAHATKDQWEQIADLTFHDLRHDFAHRAREAGWSLEEVAYYLGHVTKKGTPAIQTTVRYTQVNREQVKHKLKLLRG